MPFYEHVIIARQDISAQQAEKVAAQAGEILAENGGQVTKTEYWGLRNLAYRIKKNRKAHYTLLNVDAPYPAVAELERQLKINDDVLRFMTIRVDKLDDGPSAMMQQRAGRDDRGGRRGGDREGRDERRAKPFESVPPADEKGGEE